MVTRFLISGKAVPWGWKYGFQGGRIIDRHAPHKAGDDDEREPEQTGHQWIASKGDERKRNGRSGLNPRCLLFLDQPGKQVARLDGRVVHGDIHFGRVGKL